MKACGRNSPPARPTAAILVSKRKAESRYVGIAEHRTCKEVLKPTSCPIQPQQSCNLGPMSVRCRPPTPTAYARLARTDPTRRERSNTSRGTHRVSLSSSASFAEIWWEFVVDQSTGALTPIRGSPFPASTQGPTREITFVPGSVQ